MTDRNDYDDTTVGTVDGSAPADAGAAPDAARPEDGEAPSAQRDAAAGDQEVEILRDELRRAQQQLEEAKQEAEAFRDRYLRGRAELETYRRRVTGDLERAREAGLDSAVLTVLTVFDDLVRALQAAETADDPAAIVPGVRRVKESLERSLEGLDIRQVGAPGEPFDPNQHEALTAVPPTGDAEPGTIADVFQAGFKRGDRLVRPARVVVYQERDQD